VDVQYPGEPHPQEAHRRTVAVPAFFVGKHPVTNAAYAAFLAATKWRPRVRGTPRRPRSSVNFSPLSLYSHRKAWASSHFSANLTLSRLQVAQNWLRGWVHDGAAPAYPRGEDRLPVTWVAREDGGAYCAAVGARLVREVEWQYAAQGGDGRPWPWGWRADNATTGWTHAPNASHAQVGVEPWTLKSFVHDPAYLLYIRQTLREYTEWCSNEFNIYAYVQVMPQPTPVDAYPSGASPFGVEVLPLFF
jgi:formylglycine-generating enzyme required for sulfatase activity